MPPNLRHHRSQIPAPTRLRSVDPKVWRACAGSTVAIPVLRSRVYYFPQGHLEHAATSSEPLRLSPRVLSKPLVLCRVAAVQLLADPITDEVLAKVLLCPVKNDAPFDDEQQNDSVSSESTNDEKVVSFAKILTPSDANNGGGFSVPRFCADSIFPALNYEAEPPVQTLSVTDLHGVVWDFRHIYRGTPRRHLLTTGWSKFVNHKMLVAGDSVVFMRSAADSSMHVGVRRALRDGARWSSSSHILSNPEGNAGSYRTRLTAETVAEAAEKAAQGVAFEVVYYPKAGWSDFVVKAEVVEKALKVFWTAGMRVKMAMETDDSSRITWFQGALSSVSVPDNGPWLGSPWRMLEVTWDEPEVLQNAKRVSPWQVDFVASTPSLHTVPPFHTAPSLHTVFPPAKRFRAPMNPGLMRNGEEEFMNPITGVANSTMGQFNASMLNYNIFPAGMQGARQDLFCVSNLSHLLNDDTPQMCTYNSFVNNNTGPRLKRVSTELNIGSPQSDHLSTDSQSTHSFGVEVDGNRYCNSTKVGRSSFQLFGKTIHMNEPIDAVGCTDENDNTGYNETEVLNNPLDLSYTKLLERIDVRSSAVEACTL